MTQNYYFRFNDIKLMDKGCDSSTTLAVLCFDVNTLLCAISTKDFGLVAPRRFKLRLPLN